MMLSFFCLLSVVWSGTVVATNWKRSIHALNMAWFAVSVAGFAWSMGWLAGGG